ncbi:MAG: bis(5'-nucleosyl)-tetraphosphatase (symmetrical) YqeK [Candidatus Eremiobacteraeota bacterium]|nr:bis(5'-nucleosyl)-tetraphosphatase (symmetrical) YqeK [Candidatus Eremiobacteraeota bacterium]
MRSRLPRNRYRHVLGVARTAERLARRYGVSTHKARVAAMIHDIARNWSPEELFAYMRRHGLAISAAEQQAPALLHARVGAHLAREQFGVDDPQMLLAIERHTVAVPGMSDLEKILYVADTIEPSRSFSQRAAAAAAADLSLDKGLLACVKASMEYLTSNGIPIAPQTLALYQDLVQRGKA